MKPAKTYINNWIKDNMESVNTYPIDIEIDF